MAGFTMSRDLEAALLEPAAPPLLGRYRRDPRRAIDAGQRFCLPDCHRSQRE